MPRPGLLSTRTVAQMFDVKTPTANTWIRDGKFGTPVKVGNRWYVQESEVDAYINRRHGNDK